MAKIFFLRSSAFNLRSLTTVDGDVQWDATCQRLTVKTMSFTMNALRWWVQDLIQKARELLFGLLFISPGDSDSLYLSLPSLNLNNIHDNLKDGNPMYSFVRDKDNNAHFPDTERQNRRVGDCSGLCERMLSDIPTKKWSEKAILAYCSTRHKFLRLLLVLFHITSGQPAHGPELLSFYWRNPKRDGDSFRNIIIEDGQVVLITRYHKSQALTRGSKVISRYLPKEVGELYVYYAWLVLPFPQRIRTHFTDRGILIDLLGEEISQLWPMSALPKRRPRFCTAKRPQLDNQVGQSSSSATLQERPLPRLEEPWPSSRFGYILMKEIKVGLQTRGSILYWRQAAIMILFIYGFSKQVSQRDNAMDAQAAHTANIAGKHYGRGINESPFTTRQERERYRAVSHFWHTVILELGTTLPLRAELQAYQTTQSRRHNKRSYADGPGEADLPSSLSGGGVATAAACPESDDNEFS